MFAFTMRVRHTSQILFARLCHHLGSFIGMYTVSVYNQIAHWQLVRLTESLSPGTVLYLSLEILI